MCYTKHIVACSGTYVPVYYGYRYNKANVSTINITITLDKGYNEINKK